MMRKFPAERHGLMPFFFRFINIFFCCVCFAFALKAENAVGPDFLFVQPHARTAAMNNSFTGVADDANAVIFNPAGLPWLEKNSVSLTHYSSFADTNYENIMFACPQKGWGFGGRVLADYTSNFSEISMTGEDKGQVANYDLLFAGSFGFAIMPGFSAGATAKYFTSTLLNYTKSGYALDMGLLFGVSPEVNIGFTLENLGSQGAYEQVADALPLKLTAGVGYKHKVNEVIGLVAAADFSRVMINKYQPDITAGAELSFYNRLFISAGFGIKQDGDNFTLGGGIMPFDFARLYYAYQPFENLGATHRMSLDVIF